MAKNCQNKMPNKISTSDKKYLLRSFNTAVNTLNSTRQIQLQTHTFVLAL
jgi:hypothetical protein